MSEKQTSSSKYSLVRAIVNFFKLGEEGQIENFFAKERKKLTRDIEKLEKRMEVEEFTHKNAVEDLNERIEDATSAIENAYLQVDPERITNNADADVFANEYWSAIEIAEANLKSLEENKESLVKAFNETIEKDKKQIAERKRRLSKISVEK